MTWTALDTGIVVVAAVSAMASALIGSFLVLRRMSMMGDAISHAVLPGIAVAFLATLSRDTGVIVIGAAVAGVLTAAFTQLIHQVGNVDRGAAMGVVFTTMFAVGLILIVRSADSVHIDVHTVFYGSVELAPLNDLVVAGVRMPRALLILGAVFAADVLFVVVLFKELNLTSFDEDFARSIGCNARLMHYGLMVMVAVTIVGGVRERRQHPGDRDADRARRGGKPVHPPAVVAAGIRPGGGAGLRRRRTRRRDHSAPLVRAGRHQHGRHDDRRGRRGGGGGAGSGPGARTGGACPAPPAWCPSLRCPALRCPALRNDARGARVNRRPDAACRSGAAPVEHDAQHLLLAAVGHLVGLLHVPVRHSVGYQPLG